MMSLSWKEFFTKASGCKLISEDKVQQDRLGQWE